MVMVLVGMTVLTGLFVHLARCARARRCPFCGGQHWPT